ncbi:MAG: ImmA/IrrE family metallo-endopeptidase [Hyphomicrobiaceae bacterium]
MIYDDYPVPPRTLKEIEAEADRCRSRAVVASDARLNLDQLMRAWGITLRVQTASKMQGAEAYSLAAEQQILCIREISRDLRFGVPLARYKVGHELGHMFLHRGASPKPLKADGNRKLVFISEDESGERQAWKFARALFVPREEFSRGESNVDIALRVGIPEGAVALRREEMQTDIDAEKPKLMPQVVAKHFEDIRRSDREALEASKRQALRDLDKLAAWGRAARIPGEDPANVRSARGFRVEWGQHEVFTSQVGWTVLNGEVRAAMDLKSR